MSSPLDAWKPGYEIDKEDRKHLHPRSDLERVADWLSAYRRGLRPAVGTVLRIAAVLTGAPWRRRK